MKPLSLIATIAALSVVGCSSLAGIGSATGASGELLNHDGTPAVMSGPAPSPSNDGDFVDSLYDTASQAWIIPVGGCDSMSITLAGRGGWPIAWYDIDSVVYEQDKTVVFDSKRTMFKYSFTLYLAK